MGAVNYFTIENITYTVEEVTAISFADSYKEDKRQIALLVQSKLNSEKSEQVVFGHDMPENKEQFLNMCDDYFSWENSQEVLETVRKK